MVAKLQDNNINKNNLVYSPLPYLQLSLNCTRYAYSVLRMVSFLSHECSFTLVMRLSLKKVQIFKQQNKQTFMVNTLKDE